MQLVQKSAEHVGPEEVSRLKVSAITNQRKQVESILKVCGRKRHSNSGTLG